MNQETVDEWLKLFVERLKECFGARLLLVGHHGSWARGDAGAESDIDAFVVVDRVDEADLEAYRTLMHGMPRVETDVSTFFGSALELQAWPRHDLVQCWYGFKELHGSREGLIPHPTDAYFIEDIRLKASTNLHQARHYLLHPHDLPAKVHNLRAAFKECFFAVQSWMLLTQRRYYPTKASLVAALEDPDDKGVVEVAMNWRETSADRTQRPLHYIQLLERWSRKMLARCLDLARYGQCRMVRPCNNASRPTPARTTRPD